MTIRRALVFYLSMVTLAVVVAWALAVWQDWRIGMVLLTLLVVEHVWRYVKIIRKNRP